jgi:hypothetical protein
MRSFKSMISFFRRLGPTALVIWGLMIYAVRAQIGESIKGMARLCAFSLTRLFPFASSDSISEYDLLSVALSDMENINNGAVTYVEGTDGFPAFSIASSANLKSPSRLVVPNKFAIMATMKTNKPPEGFLFSIVNSLDSVIQLGLKVATTPNSNINISLVYNDHATTTPTESIVSFTLPYEQKHWINFAMQVMNDRIAIFHNCLKIQEVNVTKEPKELVFESASTFYLAQAGSSRQKFEVSFSFHYSCFHQKLSKIEIERGSQTKFPCFSTKLFANMLSLLLFTRQNKTISKAHDQCSQLSI